MKLWNRKLWGISYGGDLIGSLYHDVDFTRPHYDQEPTRALVFHTRNAAREWLRQEWSAENRKSKAIRVVRVRETVKAIKK